MPNQQPSGTGPADFKESAQRSQEADIADESAAYELASEKSSSASGDEREAETASDGSGTSEGE